MRVNVYIDGFNFFYGAVKGTPYKWLDFDKMCRLLLPNHQPIKVVRYEMNLPVGLLNPHRKPSRALLPHVTFVKQIRKGVLAASQFPSAMTDKQGTFHKPASW
jgi:hypothetical protein